MRQWMLKITAYADRFCWMIWKILIGQKVSKEMQRNWIGRSIGANVRLKLKIVRKHLPSLLHA